MQEHTCKIGHMMWRWGYLRVNVSEASRDLTSTSWTWALDHLSPDFRVYWWSKWQVSETQTEPSASSARMFKYKSVPVIKHLHPLRFSVLKTTNNYNLPASSPNSRGVCVPSHKGPDSSCGSLFDCCFLFNVAFSSLCLSCISVHECTFPQNLLISPDEAPKRQSLLFVINCDTVSHLNKVCSF